MPTLSVDNGLTTDLTRNRLRAQRSDTGEAMMPSAEARSSKISRRKLVVIAAGLLVLVGIVIIAIAREPPPSLRGAHDDYTAAVSLFERGAIEVLKMFDDGRDEHMRIAHPLGQQAADKIREVGVKFWPHEFPPN